MRPFHSPPRPDQWRRAESNVIAPYRAAATGSARARQAGEPVQALHGHVAGGQQGPAGQARGGGDPRGEPAAGRGGGQARDGRGRGKQVQPGQPGQGAGQQQRRVAQLGVRAAGHHVPQPGQRRVRPAAVHVRGQAQPAARPGALEDAAERHVVDPRAADHGQAAGRGQVLAAHQHAAPGRGGRPGLRPVHPAERVELGEEVHERGHDQPLPGGLGAQQGHLRDEAVAAAVRGADQGGQRARRVTDVRVGEQHVFRLAGRCQAALHGPHLARPAVRALARWDEPYQILEGLTGCGGQLFRDLRGAVGRVVVDQNHRQLAGVVLRQQGGKGGGQHRRLVAGRHHRGHRRPLSRVPAGWQPLVRPPEPAVAAPAGTPRRGRPRRPRPRARTSL